MIDIDREIDILFLALKLAGQAVEKSRNGESEYEIFRCFAGIIKKYDKEREKNENK